MWYKGCHQCLPGWQMRIPKSSIEYLLTACPVARLATLNRDGSPHQVPIVFTWHDGCFWSPIDGKPKQSARPTRVQNVVENPIASLLIDNYDADWTQLWWIRADVEISVVTLSDAAPDVEKIALQAKAKLEGKYPQYETTTVLRDPATMLCMRPTVFTSWCASELILPGDGNR